jgi:hypothetical protein
LSVASFGVISIPPLSMDFAEKVSAPLSKPPVAMSTSSALSEARAFCDTDAAIGVLRRPHASIGVILDTVSRGLPSWAAAAGQQVVIANPKLDDRKPVEITTALSLAQLSEYFTRNYAEELPTLGDVIEQRDDLGIIVRVIRRP